MDGSRFNKFQSKYYHTACLMDEALISLLEKKNYEYITIKEICEKAGVNRSTFYLHYESIDDLLIESIEYIGKKIKHQYEEADVIQKNNLYACPIEELMLVTPQYLIPYLNFVKDNRKIFFAAVSQPNVLKTKSISQYLFKEFFEPILNRFEVPQKEQEYRVAFYLSGIWAIIRKWLLGGCAEEPGYIADLIRKCINCAEQNLP